MAKKQNNDFSLILSNIALVCCTLIFLGAALYRYQRQIRTVTLTENRFLTTEWHLLQELKAQTDRKLEEKDLEISRLRLEYRNLKRQDLSPERLRELEAELKKAEAERADILSMRLSAAVPSQADAASPLINSDGRTGKVVDETTRPDSTAGKPLTELLGQRIQVLETRVAENRLRAETAEKELAKIIREKTLPGTVANPGAADSLPALEKTSGSAAALLSIVDQKLKEIESEEPPKIEDIRTRSLLRAIVSSPPIRKEYPDLLEALDRYFVVYGRQEWLMGQKEAYSFTKESLKSLERAEKE